MADDSAVKETVEDSSITDKAQALESAADVAEDNVDTLKARVKELSDRAAKEGRSKTQIKAEVDGLKEDLKTALKELTDSKKKVEQWNEYYFTKVAPEAERNAYMRNRSAQVQNEQMSAGQREVMWKAIADEDDPGVRSALKAAVKDGEYLGPAAINAIRRTLATRKQDDAPEKTEEEKSPPKVTATGSSSGAKTTLEQQIQAVKDNKKMGKQEKAQEIVALMSQLSARDSATRRA